MKEEIIKISKELEFGDITTEEARKKLLCLFGALKSVCIIT